MIFRCTFVYICLFFGAVKYFNYVPHTHRLKLHNLYYHSARHLRLRQGCLSCNLLRRGKRPRIFPWLLYRVFLLLLHSIYIRTVSSCCLLPALLNWFELVYRPLWQSNTDRRLDRYSDQPGRNRMNQS